MLACLTPAAIPGLTIGCLISNLISVGVMPIDLVVGTLASLLAAITMYALRKVRLFNLPVLAALMPAIFNGILVGWELTVFVIGGGFNFGTFLLTGASVALGEIVVVFGLGLPLYALMLRTPNIPRERIGAAPTKLDFYYLAGMLLPPVGLVLSIVMISSPDRENKKAGTRCLILSLIAAAVIVGVVFATVYFFKTQG